MEETKKHLQIEIKLAIILLGAILAIFIFAFIYPLLYLCHFSRAAGLRTKEVISQLRQGTRAPYHADYLNFLILGTDKRVNGTNGDSLLTDTMLLFTINSKTGNYLLFSFPRDLWLDDLKTKINALYYYGKKMDENDGTQLVKNRIETMLNWKIDYALVLEMEDIKELIDLLGGVEVNVERAFTDEEFPKDDGSNEVMTISFQEGRQFFNGETALQFMRSRKSKDEIEGNDSARQARQKKVILALKHGLISQKRKWFDPSKTAELYDFLMTKVDFDPQLSLKELASFWQIGLKTIKGSQTEKDIPWKGEEAILESGRDLVYNSWILVPKDNDWSLIETYFKANLPQ